MIKDARANYFSELTSVHKYNPRVLFKTVDLLVNPVPPCVPAESDADCEIFLSCFTSKVESIRTSVTSTASRSGLPYLQQDSFRAYSHLALLSRTVPKHECPLSPRWHTLPLLQSNCTWAHLSYLIYRAQPVFLLTFFSSFNNIFKLFSGSRDLQDGCRFFHCFYVDLYAVVCLKLGWILHKQSQWCQSVMPVLVHVHPYRSEVHLFQQCQGRQNMPCLSTKQSAHISQTNWTLGVKRAQALYGLPSVSAPLISFIPSTCRSF